MRRASLVLLLALALLRADGAAASDLIAYEALTGGVFTIRPDGSENREIAPFASSPAWSRDGSRLLFTGGDGSLWSTLPDGTDPRLIVRHEDVRVPGAGLAFTLDRASWSPSGRRIAFVASGEDANERTVEVIGTAATDGSGVRVLRRGSHPEWVGNRRIAFTVAGRAFRDFWSRMATMRRDGTLVRWLLRDRKGYRSDLRLASDGRRLAFLEQANKPGFSAPFLRVLNLRSGRIRGVPPSSTFPVAAFTWTPGGRLAYVNPPVPLGGRAAPSSVYSIRISGAGRRHVLTLPFEEQRGLWADELAWRPAHPATPTDGG